jgi:hypothetical protein
MPKQRVSLYFGRLASLLGLEDSHLARDTSQWILGVVTLLVPNVDQDRTPAIEVEQSAL